MPWQQQWHHTLLNFLGIQISNYQTEMFTLIAMEEERGILQHQHTS